MSPSFTRAGWVAFQRALADLRQRGGGEDWGLADYTAGASYQERCEALRHLYAERYIQAWLAFFERLRLDSPGSWHEAVAITTDLTQHEPLRDVFRAIHDNTQKLPPISCSEAQALLPSMLVPTPPLDPNARNSTDVAARFARLTSFAIPPAAGGQAGWSISNTMEASWVVRTLKNTIRKHGKPEIINSDQGSQFTSEEYVNFVKSQETILISMDGKGRAIDNVYIERFFRTIKYERIYLTVPNDGKEL